MFHPVTITQSRSKRRCTWRRRGFRKASSAHAVRTAETRARTSARPDRTAGAYDRLAEQVARGAEQLLTATRRGASNNCFASLGLVAVGMRSVAVPFIMVAALRVRSSCFSCCSARSRVLLLLTLSLVALAPPQPLLVLLLLSYSSPAHVAEQSSARATSSTRAPFRRLCSSTASERWFESGRFNGVDYYYNDGQHDGRRGRALLANGHARAL